MSKCTGLIMFFIFIIKTFAIPPFHYINFFKWREHKCELRRAKHCPIQSLIKSFTSSPKAITRVQIYPSRRVEWKASKFGRCTSALSTLFFEKFLVDNLLDVFPTDHSGSLVQWREPSLFINGFIDVAVKPDFSISVYNNWVHHLRKLPAKPPGRWVGLCLGALFNKNEDHLTVDFREVTD